MNHNNNTSPKQGKLRGNQKRKLTKLLYMDYRPNELAKELNIDVRWIYQIYLPLGCPCRRDNQRHVWIVGTEFREWYIKTYKTQKLAENEGYCVSCKKAVSIINPTVNTKNGVTYLQSKCPKCKNKVAKIIPTKEINHEA